MRRIPLLLFLTVCLIGGFFSRNIGFAWDEADNIYANGQYVNFFIHGFDKTYLESKAPEASYFHDRAYTLVPEIARYPPMPYYLGTIFTLIGEKFGFTTSQHVAMFFHWATVVFFALLVSYVYKFGLLLGLSSPYALLAAVMTFMYPMLFGHGLSNLKDTAQMSMFAISLYHLLRKQYVVGAVIWGLALATKMNAVYVPVIWVLAGNRKKIPLVFFIGSATAFLVWPYVWFDPIGHMREVYAYFATVGKGYQVIWNGVLYAVGAGRSMWWYPWASFVVTMPPIVLVLGVIGVIREIRRRRWVLLFWLVIPLLRAIFPYAAFYDGMRHFMEVMPAWMLLAAIGLAKLSSLGRLRNLGNLIGIIVIVHMIFINIAYFPFTTGYYNFLAKFPNERFDRDIEALSVKETMDYLHANYGIITVHYHIGGHLAWHYMNPQDRYLYAKDADSIVIVNKRSHPVDKALEALIQEEFRIVHTIRRADMILAWVYRRI